MITHEVRRQIIQEFLATHCFPVLKAKGQDYAQTDRQDDVNANFKRAAERWGTTVLQAWGVYFGKHIDAIETYIRRGGQAESEPIIGRITDAVNYLFILVTLLEDAAAKQEHEKELHALDQRDDAFHEEMARSREEA
jgi:hypothetical protein